MSQYTNVPDYHLRGDSLPRRAMRQSAPQPAAAVAEPPRASPPLSLPLLPPPPPPPETELLGLFMASRSTSREILRDSKKRRLVCSRAKGKEGSQRVLDQGRGSRGKGDGERRWWRLR